jgi:ferritin-like metal-binding protein YciE
LEKHREETLVHVDRLNDAAKELNINLEGAFCYGMEGLVKEAKKTMKEVENNDVMDAAIIAAAQRIEHYEIAGYGTAASMAKELGYDKCADLLSDTLGEEKHADSKLSKLAEGGWFSGGLNEEAQDQRKSHVA